MANNQPLPGVDRWQALDLQLIAFPQDPQGVRNQDWWRELTGLDEFNSSRRALETSTEGTFEGRSLILQTDVLRIAWRAAPILDLQRERALDGPPSAGSFQEATEWFSRLMDRWLDGMCPPIKRLAFAGKLFLGTASRDESYHLLNQFLPSVEVDPTSSEFQYRINRPRPSRTGINGLVINRLITWSSIRLTIQMEAQSGTGTGIRSESVVNRNFDGCMMQFDINTAQEFDTGISTESRIPIWNELTALTSEIAQNGDIP